MLAMLKVLVLFFVLVPQLVYAKNIVFLSSLPLKDQKTTLKLKKLFFKKLYGVSQFANGHQLIYHSNADAELLYKYLNDPDTMALFWVGHGGFKKISSTSEVGIQPTPVLFDYKQRNISKVFQKVHPNIKFLAVIGCNSWQILKNVISSRSDLGYYIPSKKVVATWSFRKALRKFRKHFWTIKYHYISEDIKQQGIPITIERSTTSNTPLMIFAGKKLIGVFPASSTSQYLKKNFMIPLYTDFTNLKKHDLKITFSSGQNARDNFDNFGDIVIRYDGQRLWKLFAKSDGSAFGVNVRIFLFNNSLDDIFTEDYILYNSQNEE
jgi:hypothetical protein